MPSKVKSSKKNITDQDKTADAWREEDRENLEILEFIQAIDRYKRRTQKSFPAWSEVLRILKDLGYKKVRD